MNNSKHDRFYLNSSQRDSDKDFEFSLRPTSFGDFIGQEKLKSNLRLFVKAAKKRGDPLDHVLLCGPPGLGKTTMARILANELGVAIHTTSGPVLEKKGDLAGNLTNLNEKEILFIDEIHRLSRVVEECLYPAIEDYVFDIITGEGPAARSIRIPLNRFTLVGSTTRAGMLTSPMFTRFGFVGRINYYTSDNLKQIAMQSAEKLKVECEEKAALELGRRARGTPRIVNRLLRRARDVADVKGDGKITEGVVKDTLEMLGVDEKGLDEIDRRILLSIIHNYGGGPVGISTVAVVVGEEPDTIEEVYEPYLIQAGFLKRTPRGREVTSYTYRYFDIQPGKVSGESQINIFNDNS